MLSPPSIVETSAKLATASPPAFLISSTTWAAGPSSCPEPSGLTPGSLTMTRAPSEAARSAHSRPMPRPAPVRAMTLPSSRFAMGLCLSPCSGEPHGGGARGGLLALWVLGPDLEIDELFAVCLVLLLDNSAAGDLFVRVVHAPVAAPERLDSPGVAHKIVDK